VAGLITGMKEVALDGVNWPFIKFLYVGMFVESSSHASDGSVVVDRYRNRLRWRRTLIALVL